MVVICKRSHALWYFLGMLPPGLTFLEAAFALAAADGIRARTDLHQ